MFQIKVVEKIQTHFMYDKSSPPPENRSVYEIMSKNMAENTDDNMAQALSMLDKSPCAHPHTYAPATQMYARTHTQKYKKTAFNKSTTVTETRLNVTLHVHCLPCSICVYAQAISCYFDSHAQTLMNDTRHSLNTASVPA
jgi:hypothetical protein